MKVRKSVVLSAISLGVLVYLFSLQGTVAQGTLSITFYGDPSCPACGVAEQTVKDFVTRHPEISAVYVHGDYNSNATLMQELQNSYVLYGLNIQSVPVAILNNSGTLQALFYENLNALALESWLVGALEGPITLWETFVFGLVFGASPCLLLIMSVLGTSLVAVEERKKYLAISVGLILGIIAAYVLISIIFLAFLGLIGFFAYFRYVFGGILLTIGIWQIVEFKKEKSTIFGTPDRVKKWLKSFIEKQSGPYAFLLGILFAFVKIPCVGGIYLTIVYNAWQNPLLIYYVILYYLGMILPVVILLIALRVGLQSNRINSFREKYRSHLRLLSGIALIALTVYLMFFVG